MTTKTKTAKKAPAAPATPAISPAIVKRVIGMRKKGMTWAEITEALDQPDHFVIKIRPLMMKMDRKSVGKKASA